MNKLVIIILILLFLIICYKKQEHFECSKEKWLDDSCSDANNGVCKDRKINSDGTNTKWDCHKFNKNIVILFYTDWCMYSKNFMPIWENISQKYNSDDTIEFIKINCDPDLKECPNPNAVASGTTPAPKNCSNGKEIYSDYNISQVPMVLFIPTEETYKDGIKFNLSMNGIDTDIEENKIQFDNFIIQNIKNFQLPD